MKKNVPTRPVAVEVQQLYQRRNEWTEASGRLEFKKGAGGLPKDLWPTYSAFANTHGGLILLGVTNQGRVTGLPHADHLRNELVNILSSGTKCSQMLCAENDIGIAQLDGQDVLDIRVREAPASLKPVFLDGNITKAYIRRLEGDALCTKEELARMLRDRDVITTQYSADADIIAGSGLDDLDPQTIEQYRADLAYSRTRHPWAQLSNEALLVKLGAFRTNRQTGEKGLTLAGLLMFGRTETIKELHPIFKIDFFEYDGSEQASSRQRWADRITSDGTWESNLYQFFMRVLPRLAADLKRPFRLADDMHRRDDSSAHDAVREALANAIIHADYREPGGIRITKRPTGLELTNAGTLMVSPEEAFAGGISRCRNRNLQTMFKLVGIVEEAGSGVDTMVKGWAEHFLCRPQLEEEKQIPQVTWRLPYMAMLSKNLIYVHQTYLGQEKYARLSPAEKMLLLMIPANKHVSNRELRVYLPGVHTTDLGRMLSKLREEGYLLNEGRSSAMKYRLPDRLALMVQTAHDSQITALNEEGEPASKNQITNTIDSSLETRRITSISKTEPSSALNGGKYSALNGGKYSALNGEGNSALNEPPGVLEQQLSLSSELRQELADFRRKMRHNKQDTDHLILQLCTGRYLSLTQLSLLLDRGARALRRDFVSPLARHGQLLRKEAKINHKEQAYTTAPMKTDKHGQEGTSYPV